MRSSLALSALAVLALAWWHGAASADPPASAGDAPKPAGDAPKPAKVAKDAPKAAGSKEIKKDPEGKRGISPYMELVAKGEGALVARDLPGAVGAFQEATKLDAEKMLGFYRLGEAFLQSGKLD